MRRYRGWNGREIMGKIKKPRKWYWWLGLAIVLFWLGIPQAVFKSVLYLAESLPRHAVVELANVPLNLAEWLFVTTPSRIAEAPVSGTFIFIGSIAVLGIGIWLMCRKPKNPKHT
jgi:hypothetical protein